MQAMAFTSTGEFSRISYFNYQAKLPIVILIAVLCCTYGKHNGPSAWYEDTDRQCEAKPSTYKRKKSELCAGLRSQKGPDIKHEKGAKEDSRSLLSEQIECKSHILRVRTRTTEV
jgi:hypothetical protein